ncbi:hypothetical protein DVR12_12710 [Chitinophaga silvatica]|uniref:Outer membrane protein beta-barrel domain-containing protein n=1 Tax=Chitinophaga silvatica TaxID=2282649 RepID=A0A3E1YAZ5_9BACT|nr:DUF6048 family protein [Chitinophaga silvatica]RFS22651.1 hypothetical protein DVR12_12710 [Chitinophaga silvatica]
MTRTLLCFSLISSFLFCFSAQAQNKQQKDSLHKAAIDTVHKTASDTARKTVKLPHDSIYYIPGGVRIGLDLSRIVTAIYYPYRKEVTIVADARINDNWYAAFEGGFASTPHSDTNYTYKGTGYFATVGVDYNFLKPQYPTEKNIFYVGMRYGFSHFNYSVPSYLIKDSYWGQNITGSIPSTNANAHWIELVVGLKAEVLKNFFLGWNLRERFLLNTVKTPDFTPLVIPGFGNGAKRAVFDVQYTVSYLIPFYRIKQQKKLVEIKPKKVPKK